MTTYYPAQIPVDYQHTRAGILWTAANLVAMTDTTDGLTQAMRQAHLDTDQAHALESLACARARRRCSSRQLANGAAAVDTWETWQTILDRREAWDVLAFLALELSTKTDHHNGLISGAYELATPLFAANVRNFVRHHP